MNEGNVYGGAPASASHADAYANAIHVELPDTGAPVSASCAVPSKPAARKRLVVYLAVTFVLTWGVQIPAGITLGAFENGELASPAILAIIAISMFFPLIGALVANRACGNEGRIDLCLRPRIKGNGRLYLVAWFTPALFTLLGCLVFFAVNPSFFDPSMSSSTASLLATVETAGGSGAGNVPSAQELVDMMPMLVGVIMAFALTIAPFINAIPAFGEEVGWRGMLFPTLCELMSTRAAVIVSGIIWGLWHAPVIAMGHNFGMDYPGFPWVGILTMVLACTALGSFLAYLRVRTKSTWSCALAHGAVNAIANVGLYWCVGGLTPAGPSPLGYIAGIPMIVLGIVCWLKIDAAKRME